MRGLRLINRQLRLGDFVSVSLRHCGDFMGKPISLIGVRYELIQQRGYRAD
jgi:hypothetical protein